MEPLTPRSGGAAPLSQMLLTREKGWGIPVAILFGSWSTCALQATIRGSATNLLSARSGQRIGTLTLTMYGRYCTTFEDGVSTLSSQGKGGNNTNFQEKDE